MQDSYVLIIGRKKFEKKTSKIDVFCRDPIHILFVCEKLPTSVTFIYSPHIQSYAWSEFDDSLLRVDLFLKKVNQICIMNYITDWLGKIFRTSH